MKRAWLLIFAVLFLTFAPPNANACGKTISRNACAAETLQSASAPTSDLPALLPEPFTTTLPKLPLLIREASPRAERLQPSPLAHQEVRARGVPYHGDSPPPYLLPSVSS